MISIEEANKIITGQVEEIEEDKIQEISIDQANKIIAKDIEAKDFPLMFDCIFLQYHKDFKAFINSCLQLNPSTSGPE